MNSLRTLVRIASPQSLTGWNCRFFKIYKNIFFIKKKKFKNYFFYKIYFFIKLKTLRAMEDVWKFSSALWGSPKNDDKSSHQKKTHTTAVHFLAHRHHPYLRPFSFHRENCLTRTRRISHWGEGQLPGYNFSYRPSAPSEIFFKTSSRYQKILRSIEIASLLRRRLNKWKKNHFFSCVFIIAFLKKKK